MILKDAGFLPPAGKYCATVLQARDCLLAGVDRCASVAVQESRFTDVGWTSAVCRDMWTIYNGLRDKTVFVFQCFCNTLVFISCCIAIAAWVGRSLARFSSEVVPWCLFTIRINEVFCSEHFSISSRALSVEMFYFANRSWLYNFPCKTESAFIWVGF